MKRLIIIPLLLLALLGEAQDKKFALFGRTELADKNTHNDNFDYGVNLGFGINYQMTITYFEAEVYMFPDLNGMDYIHFQGTILGFNHHSWNEDWRYYIGLLRPGLIIRDGGPHGLFGMDLGIEHYFNNGAFLGLKTGYDWKGDSKIWSDESTHQVWYASLTFGIVL